MRSAIRDTLAALGLLGAARTIRARLRRAILGASEVGFSTQRVSRGLNKTRMDEDFLQFAFRDDRKAIISALREAVGPPPRKLRLIGSVLATDDLLAALQGIGHNVERRVWSYADPIPPEGLGAGILCEIPKTFSDWSTFATVTDCAQLQPIWQLVLPSSVLREMLSVYEYNASTLEELFKVYRGRSDDVVGRRSRQHIDRIEEFIPLRDKTIIEFGPSDGNHTADLLACGAAHVLAVEGRPENIIKLLAAKQVMGWTNFDVVIDNFQSTGSWAHRRYDLIYAQGVYYHCQNPLVFIDNLTRLGDAIFIGGWAATDERPQSPWIQLEHSGETYRGKVYTESFHFLSGLASQSYMLARSEIERFLASRGFATQYCDVTVDKDGLSTEFIRLLAVKRQSKSRVTETTP